MALALQTTDLVKEYPRRRSTPVQALRGVSVALETGRTLGIVGESGCGKSTLARLLVGLEAPTSGSVELLGEPLPAHPHRGLLARKIQLVFQDPYSSLDPRLTVSAALGEVLGVHGLAPRGRARQARVEELLAMVALGSRFLQRYPHELSGGQAQRVAVARALAVEPKVLVLDEPTSALDVSVRAEVMNLLVRLQDELRLSYVFISHDLAMVRHVADAIAVMYLGRVVEEGPYDAVLGASLHPYTRALAEAVPTPDPVAEARRRSKPVGEAPAGTGEAPAGCPYNPRCPLAEDICREVRPELLELAPAHRAACHVAARHAGVPSAVLGSPWTA
ncbi:MAG: Oligopeptide transporter ATP-binding protein OppF [Acidimicrobiaceae bacterium]|nr:Oligopeptide transporter ATP-binding protein OppF [Acidimicrobiaceae bacterium]